MVRTTTVWSAGKVLQRGACAVRGFASEELGLNSDAFGSGSGCGSGWKAGRQRRDERRSLRCDEEQGARLKTDADGGVREEERRGVVAKARV